MSAGYFQYLGLFQGAWRSSGIPTLGIDDIQQTVVAMLKADSALTTELGGSTEIREDFWPGSDWAYPAVRVNVQSLSPATNGNCHLSTWDLEFSVLVFVQPSLAAGVYDASSNQCADIMDYIVDALFGKTLSSDRFITETRINVVNELGPTPELPPGGWRGEVVCTAGLQEIG